MEKSEKTMFSSGGDLANFLVSSDLLSCSWDAISGLYGETNLSEPRCILKYRRYRLPRNGMILAFVSSPPCTARHLQGEGTGLVSSVDLRGRFPLFEFLGTKVNPSFFLHHAAVSLFFSHKDLLSRLKDQCSKTDSSPLIITGHSIGGSIASLFTLWLIDSIFPKATTRPLCITFGSPFLGDKSLQQAISERPIWNSCFLHVAAVQDPILRPFALPQAPEVISHTTSPYKPFGTYLLCSQSGCTCFEEPESVLDLMEAMGCGFGSGGSNEGWQVFDYGDFLKELKRKAIIKGISLPGGWHVSPLQAGILTQIAAIKVDRTQGQGGSGEFNPLMAKIEGRIKDLAVRKGRRFDPNKKLNDMKINMVYLEHFKKRSSRHGGYYDAFRNMHSRSREEIVKKKSILAQYWKRMVEEADKMPQKEGAFSRKRWLCGGNNYRRLAEPLDIAECYGKGNRNYVEKRSDHYKKLEEWENEAKQLGQLSNANGRDRACILTEDSCFWAKVEEAVIACKLLKGEESYLGDKESLVEKLVDFEDYVMDLIRKYAVSAEIFSGGSSFMKWWEDYDRIRGTSYNSRLANFMRAREYERYA